MIYISFDIGVKNLALCVIRQTEILEILDWRIIELAASKKEIRGIDDISERIYIEMDNIIGGLKSRGIDMIDYVLIENQPSNLNGIMKTIQHIIYGYFSLIKYWDKDVGSVVLVNAALKTKNHTYIINIEEKEGIIGGGARNKKGFRRDKYKNNKLLSIALCREYISDDDKLQKIFNENKKKDDLSDACLQTVSYIRSNMKGDISNKYNKIYSSSLCYNEDNEKEEAS